MHQTLLSNLLTLVMLIKHYQRILKVTLQKRIKFLKKMVTTFIIQIPNMNVKNVMTQDIQTIKATSNKSYTTLLITTQIFMIQKIKTLINLYQITIQMNLIKKNMALKFHLKRTLKRFLKHVTISQIILTMLKQTTYYSAVLQDQERHSYHLVLLMK